MKKIWSIFGAVIVMATTAAFLNAQPADKLEAYKKAREEFQQAEKAVSSRQMGNDNVQKDLEKLEEEKALWGRELSFYRNKLTHAQSQMEASISKGALEEVERWKREVALLEAKVKNAEQEVAKNEEQYKNAIQNIQRTLKDSYDSNLILPGEAIEVMVMEDDSFNGIYQIRRGGYIILPRVGRVSVAGKDLAGAEKSIKEALQQSQVKDATVMVERPEGAGTASGPVIYLAGEFRTPGPWKIPQGVSPTVVTTVLRSGGLTEAADLTRVRVLRLVSGQPLVEEVNVQAILDGVGLPSDLALNPGDIIMVPPVANVVYITGNVVKPGTLKVLPDDELTAYSAVLRCGGFARFANRAKMFVLRDRGDGEKQRISINVKEVQRGKIPDVVLEPKDIVVVPEKFFSF